MSVQVSYRSRFRRAVTRIFQLLMASLFIFSGVVKLIDPIGTRIKMIDYLSAFGYDNIFADSTLLIFAVILAGFEFIMGIYLALGLYKRGTLTMLLLFMLCMTPLTLYLAIENPIEDCGCFGDAVSLTNWQTFSKNLFLLLMLLYLIVRRELLYTLISEKRQWIVTLVAVLLITRFSVNNIRELPILDFRPYKIGVNLREQRETNAEFFDLFLMDDSLNDVTSSLLSDSNYTFVMVAEHLERSDESHMDRFEEISDYAERWGYNYLVLTSSGREMVNRWIYDNGNEWRILYADEIPLQTMIRANPGLILLKNGSIVNKWGGGNLPEDYELTTSLEASKLGECREYRVTERILIILSVLLLPFLLIWLIDFLKESESNIQNI